MTLLTNTEFMRIINESSKLPDSFDRDYKIASFSELIDTFPDAIPAARKSSKKMIKELNSAISGLSDFRNIWTEDIQKLHFSKQPAYIEYLNDLIERIQEGYEREIKKYQYQIDYLDNYGKPKEVGLNDITPERIERARQFPITEMLVFKRGQTTCPFHDDHKPSLKYYPQDNHVFCFSCSHRADAIDVAMKVWGLDFREAVRRLAV